jgi:hypothetical protein
LTFDIHFKQEKNDSFFILDEANIDNTQKSLEIDIKLQSQMGEIMR